MAKNVVDALSSKFGEKILETHEQHGDEVVVVGSEALVEIATWLRDDDKMAFDSPVFVTCIDRLGFGEEPRFEVCYQLRSHRHRHRIRIKVRVSDEAPKVPSLCGLWPAFNWQERETFDMYGIEFDGHPDLRRIYMYEEFEGHPLRKDYPKDKRQPLVRRDWSE
mgnify:CR=1 FL=1